MMMKTLKGKRSLMVAIILVGSMLLVSRSVGFRQKNDRISRQLEVSEPLPAAAEAANNNNKRDSMPYSLPGWAETWCLPPKQPPVSYSRCDKDGIINAVPVFGGLTNALKFVLLGAIYSIERNECFFLDESHARLRIRTNKSEEFDSLMKHYFEPIGLSPDSDIVQKAITKRRVKYLHGIHDLYSNSHVRRSYRDTSELASIGVGEMNGHGLKRYMMKRVWRPHEEIRNHTCSVLDSIHGLHEPYMAFSIRRGDKKEVEHFEYTDLEEYIQHAEPMMEKHFHGVVPKIFVATDDCSVMPEFRKLKPEWTFLSECDHMSTQEQGFALKDVQSWTKEETDAHFRKFFIELYGLAIAKIYIGVSITNVAWWAYFMRQDQWSFRLVDLDEGTINRIKAWR